MNYYLMLRSRSTFYKKKQIMRSLSRRFLYRVIALEGEILSFAQPLESIQRKGCSIAAQSALLPTQGIDAAPLWVNPDKTCGARRGRLEQNKVTA
jgi:hypothetical protein